MAKKNLRVTPTSSGAVVRPEEPQAQPVRPDALTAGEFSWLSVARKEIGQKEIAGHAHNPRIIEYHGTTTLRGSADEIPWCSSFVNWVMKTAGYKGTRSAAARSWTEWGQRIRTPIKGCIVVLTRNGGGHVGFYMGMKDGRVQILGGNQSNAVNIAPYAAERIIAYVLPRNMTEHDNQVFYDATARIA